MRRSPGLRAGRRDVPFLRPAEFATDASPVVDAVLHAVDTLKDDCHYVVLLQATSPFRTSADIDGVIETCARLDAPACVSVTQLAKTPAWTFTIDADRRLRPLLAGAQVSARRRNKLWLLFPTERSTLPRWIGSDEPKVSTASEWPHTRCPPNAQLTSTGVGESLPEAMLRSLQLERPPRALRRKSPICIPRNERSVAGASAPSRRSRPRKLLCGRGADIGKGTKIWHFCHVMKGAKIGRGCPSGRMSCRMAAPHRQQLSKSRIMSRFTPAWKSKTTYSSGRAACSDQRHQSPLSSVPQVRIYEQTLVQRGCTIGANATIVCGVRSVLCLRRRGLGSDARRCGFCPHEGRAGAAHRV